MNTRAAIESRVLADLMFQAPQPSQDWLLGKDFGYRHNPEIFRALVELRKAGITHPGVVVLWAWLSEHKSVVTADALGEIATQVTNHENVRAYVATLKRMSAASSLQSLGASLSSGTDPDDMLALTTTVAEEAAAVLSRDDTESQESVIDDLLAEIEVGPDPRRVSTGIVDLDGFGTLERGSVNVLAARTSIGKTALAVTMALNAAVIGRGVVYLAAEEVPREIIRRLGLCFAGRSGGAPLAQALTMLKQFPVRVRSGRRMAHIDQAVIEGQNTTGAEFLIIDHLQELHAEKARDRIHEIGELLRGIRALARDRNVAVLLLCQLSRRPDSRMDKRPELSDLRDSGEIENMADRVWLLHRDDRMSLEADLLIAKNRSGRTGKVLLDMIPSESRFTARQEML